MRRRGRDASDGGAWRECGLRQGGGRCRCSGRCRLWVGGLPLLGLMEELGGEEVRREDMGDLTVSSVALRCTQVRG